MGKEIKDIVKDILNNKLTRDTDDKHGKGFRDLAEDVACSFRNMIMDNHCEDLQESIYNTLWEVMEAVQGLYKGKEKLRNAISMEVSSSVMDLIDEYLEIK